MLYIRVLWELLRYDITLAWRGMQGVRASAAVRVRRTVRADEKGIAQAVAAVLPLYWKRVRCLQRSVVTARIMRWYGVGAEVVIGYQTAPFFSHAWVEVAGRAVGDSSMYSKRLQVLERL